MPIVHFAATPEDIEYVYENGPRSCMTRGSEYFPSNCSVHPSRPYGNSDLQIAYTRDRYRKISARGVVWPDKKVYHRVYGMTDGHRFQLAGELETLGYIRGDNWCFAGARLRHIKDGEGAIILPHLDGHGYRGEHKWTKNISIIDDDWIKIDRNGTIPGGRGRVEIPVPIPCGCGTCGQKSFCEEMIHACGGRWRKECIKTHNLTRCSVTGHYDRKENFVPVRWNWDHHRNFSSENTAFQTYAVSRGWAECNHNCFLCEGSNILHYRGNFRSVCMHDGAIWSDAHLHFHGTQGPDGHYYPKDKVPPRPKAQAPASGTLTIGQAGLAGQAMTWNFADVVFQVQDNFIRGQDANGMIIIEPAPPPPRRNR